MTVSALLWLLALPARAHDYPIKPVEAVLRVEPDRLVVDLTSDSIYWIEEVTGLHPMPPNAWPADALIKTEFYTNNHLRLSADGQALHGRLIEASYVQRPWEVSEQGTFRLRMTYPSVSDGSVIQGHADFFEDYRQERLEGKQRILPSMDFRTLLSVPGKRHFLFELKPGASAFSLQGADGRRTVPARFVESLKAGVEAVLGSAPAWPALAALALSLAPGHPSPGRWAALLLPVLALGAVPCSARWLPWAAGLTASAAAGRWLMDGAAPWLESASAAALGAYWSGAAMPWLPRALPGLFERFAAIIGESVAFVAVLCIGLLAVSVERRNLLALSQSRCEELFSRRRRLAATALLIVSGYGLAQALHS
jgi:hypothetical protein